MSGTSRHGPGQEIFWTLRSYQAAAVALPHPDETWEAREVDDELTRQLKRFNARGIIEIAERSRPHRYKWQTKRSVWPVVQQFRDQGNWTPCGHKGIRNLGDGEFSCCNDNCEETFGRETAEEVVA